MINLGSPIQHGVSANAFKIAGALVCLNGAPAIAAPIDNLMDLMKFPEVIGILVDEGRSMAEITPDTDLGIPQVVWKRMIEKLYEQSAMAAAFKVEFSDAFGGSDLTPIIAFYESDLGQEIAQLELDARRAISDDDVLLAAGDMWAELDPKSRRAQLIEDYVVSNDLIEMNVVGSMNSDIAYYRGLSLGAKDGTGPSDVDIMREVMAGEPDARAQVIEWVYGFSTLAYQPLDEDEFEAYIDFGKSKSGQALNHAMFAAFDNVYAELARGLGAGTAKLLQTFDGQDL